MRSGWEGRPRPALVLLIAASVALLASAVGGGWLLESPAPAAAAEPEPTHAVTSPAPAGGRLGFPYTHTFSATPAGATWSVTAGALPGGLTLDPTTGVLSGVPTAPGTVDGLEVTASWSEPFTAISGGGNHTCALTPTGAADCWGRNASGQATDQAGPYGAIAAGGAFTCGLTPAGAADCWGLYDQDQAGPFIALTAGGAHACGLAAAGAVDCWGVDIYGGATDQAGPYTAVSAGDFHTCALTPAGAADCWGESTWGQAADQVGPYVALAAGPNHTCARTSAGAADCWGKNLQGQATDQTGPFTAVVAGDNHSCGLTPAGAADCWGTGSPAVDHTGPFTTITAGASHTCGVLVTGGAECWGDDAFGEAADQPAPVVATAAQRFSMTIGPAATVTSPLPEPGVVGVPYTHRFTTSPSPEAREEGWDWWTGWSIRAGSLPGGLALEPRGSMVGTPREAGRFPGIRVASFWVFPRTDVLAVQDFTMTVFDTVATSGPPAVVNAAAIPAGGLEVGFDTVPSGLGATFECRVNGGAASACTSPLNLGSPADGSYTVSVAATLDEVSDPTPATWSWTVDATAPVVTFTDAPASPTDDPSATLAFTVDDPAATVTCSLDGAVPAPCSSPVTTDALGDGSHTFSVSAADAAGNVGSSVHAWTIDTATPVIEITGAPPATTVDTAATFTYTVDDDVPVQGAAVPGGNDAADGLTVTCTLDDGPATACTSPVTYGGLAVGDHTWTIEAVDAAGNTASAERSWIVTAPSPPPGPSPAPPAVVAPAPQPAAPAAAGPVASAGSGLPPTGADPVRLLLVAGALLVGGLATAAVARSSGRRRREG